MFIREDSTRDLITTSIYILHAYRYIMFTLFIYLQRSLTIFGPKHVTAIRTHCLSKILRIHYYGYNNNNNNNSISFFLKKRFRCSPYDLLDTIIIPTRSVYVYTKHRYIGLSHVFSFKMHMAYIL